MAMQQGGQKLTLVLGMQKSQMRLDIKSLKARKQKLEYRNQKLWDIGTINGRMRVWNIFKFRGWVMGMRIHGLWMSYENQG